MPRKYEVPVCTGRGGAFPIGCTCEKAHAKTGKVATAVDLRDVEPLVRAAREALDLFEGPEHHVGGRLAAALKAFEEDS